MITRGYRRLGVQTARTLVWLRGVSPGWCGSALERLRNIGMSAKKRGTESWVRDRRGSEECCSTHPLATKGGASAAALDLACWMATGVGWPGKKRIEDRWCT